MKAKVIDEVVQDVADRSSAGSSNAVLVDLACEGVADAGFRKVESLVSVPSIDLASVAAPAAVRAKTRFTTIEVGPLPVDVINRTLELDLEPGLLIFTGGAQHHVHGRHPDDLPVVLAHLARIGGDPLYVGDDHKNPDKIEMVSKVPTTDGGSAFILVAVLIERDEYGNYRIASCYRVSEQAVQKRRDRGFLRNARYT